MLLQASIKVSSTENGIIFGNIGNNDGVDLSIPKQVPIDWCNMHLCDP